jgi:hypothetical protein
MCGRLIKQITNRMVTLCHIKILSAFPSIFQTKYFPCFVCQIPFLLLIQHLAHCVEDVFIKKLRYFVYGKYSLENYKKSSQFLWRQCLQIQLFTVSFFK